jgi:hypothetical protein
MRKSPSREVQTLVLTASRRRCCICFGLHRDTSIKRGQLAHLDQNPENSDEENIAYLCLDHHDWYDTKPSQSKGLTIGEVKHYREELYTILQQRDSRDLEISVRSHSAETHAVSVPVTQWDRPVADYPKFLGVEALPPEPAIFLSETPDDILSAIKLLPPLDQQEATKIYVGRWLRYEGVVFAVQLGDRLYTVTLYNDSNARGAMVILTFPLVWRPDVDPLREGDRLSVEGQVRYIGRQVELVYPRITGRWQAAK